MNGTLGQRWYRAFMESVQSHGSGAALREAALASALNKWTGALTDVVVGTFAGLGWTGAARGHRSSLLPVPREEYLSLDVVAFGTAEEGRWRFPVAVFELENSTEDDRVAYSLWKVLCVRAALRVVFCYRRDAAQGSQLVGRVADEVVRAIRTAERVAVGGETLMIVGSRSEAETFPYGFFKDWTLDSGTGRFCRG